MVLEGRVNGPAIFVQPYLLRVFAEDYFILCGLRPCWDVCYLDRVRREEKGGSGYVCILFGREDEAEVAVLASTKVTLNRRRVHCQELMDLLDGGVVRLVEVLG